MAREADEANVPQREDLSFPRSLPEFQRLFPERGLWPTWRRRGGVTGSSAPIARRRRASPAGPALALSKVPPRHRADGGGSWSAPIRRWAYGSGRHASQTPACLPHSSSARSGFPVTKPPFRSSTSSALVWFGRIRRIGSEACECRSRRNLGRRPHARQGPGRSTSFLSPAPLKCDSASREPSSISGRAVATPSDSLSARRSAESLCGFVEGAVTSGASVRRLVRLYQPRQARLQTPRRRRAKLPGR